MTILRRLSTMLALPLLLACGSVAHVTAAGGHLAVVDRASALQPDATPTTATVAQPATADVPIQPAIRTPHQAPVQTVVVAASSARTNPTPKPSPTPWIPPLLICPKPIPPDWITLASPPICEPEHVYAFVAPPGWKLGDPVPPFKPAP